MKRFVVVMILFLSVCVSADEVKEIYVGNCSLTVEVAKTNYQMSKGLLGHTEDTFTQDGMLFDFSEDHKKMVKTFHTVGMSMTIYIIGLNRIDIANNNQVNTYEVVGIRRAPAQQETIPVNGEVVLEVTEKRFIDLFGNSYGFMSCVKDGVKKSAH